MGSRAGELSKSKRNRSASYPALTLEKAVQGITQIKDSLGLGPFDRESAARALGYSGLSGASSTSVAAMVHYGFLNRKGDVYEVSALAEDLITPRQEADRQAALVDAAMHPKLFRNLLDKYGGRSVPSMLDHILSRDHGINERVASEVKKIFVSSMATAGLLENGVLLQVVDLTRNARPEVALQTNVLSEASSAPVAASAANASIPPAVVPQPLPAVASGAQQFIEIAEGFSLTYIGSLPFGLVTSKEFVDALTDLKKAIDAYHSHGTSQQPKAEM